MKVSQVTDTCKVMHIIEKFFLSLFFPLNLRINHTCFSCSDKYELQQRCKRSQIEDNAQGVVTREYVSLSVYVEPQAV